MGIFNQRKPRGFQHKYIYVDERKERLQAMEERAKRELGLIPSEPLTTEDRVRGKIVEQTTHLKRKQEKEGGIASRRLIIIAVLLIALMLVLLNR